MTMPDSHQQLVQLFQRFREAVLSGDADAFERLTAKDVPPQRELFARNSERVRAGKMDLELRRIEQEGLMATVTFELRDVRGDRVDEGELVASEEAEGWRIRSL